MHGRRCGRRQLLLGGHDREPALFSPEELRAARAELVAAGLIAYRVPFYQVLSLEPGAAASLARLPEPRAGEALSIGEILRSMIQAP